MEYQIKFHPAALQEFCKLDGSIKKLVKKQLDKLKNLIFWVKNSATKTNMIYQATEKCMPAKSRSALFIPS